MLLKNANRVQLFVICPAHFLEKLHIRRVGRTFLIFLFNEQNALC